MFSYKIDVTGVWRFHAGLRQAKCADSFHAQRQKGANAVYILILEQKGLVLDLQSDFQCLIYLDNF